MKNADTTYTIYQYPTWPKKEDGTRDHYKSGICPENIIPGGDHLDREQAADIINRQKLVLNAEGYDGERVTFADGHGMPGWFMRKYDAKGEVVEQLELYCRPDDSHSAPCDARR